MSMSARRIRAIFRKELREYRRHPSIVWAVAIFQKELREYERNGFIVATMAVIPLIFTIAPLIEVIALPADASNALLSGDPLAILLGIPALVPATVAAYAVAGERQQGTLEPVLTTPIRREEFLLAKAGATLVPSLAISLAVYGLFLVCVELFAQPAVASAVLNGPDILAQLVFTPLLATWSIWVGIAISARATDLRVAQQLGALASLPPVVVLYLIAYAVIPVSLGLVLGFALLLVVFDGMGWRIVSAMFDRERLITGTR
jgi:ABC-type transport system involved in multi-copper enzyme maturation permease subunit